MLSNYYNGTSAYQIMDFVYSKPDQETVSKKADHTARSKKTEALHRLYGAMVLVAIFVFAASFLFTNAIIIEKASKVSDMQNELHAIVAQNNQKTLEIERTLDLKRIEDIAINELGMKHPDKYQMVYVNVEQSNYAEITAEKGRTWGSAMTAMANGAGYVKEYID